MDMDMNVDWYMDVDSSWVWIYINKYMDRGWYIDMIQIGIYVNFGI